MKIRVLKIIKYFVIFNLLFVCSLVSAQTPNHYITEDLTKLKIRKIEVRGNTVFPQPKLEALVEPYLKGEISYEQISQVVKKITDLYTTNGYLTSGAYFPQQEIIDEVAMIYVVEGKLERIEVQGTKKLTEDYLLSKLQWSSQLPLNVPSLQEKIQLIQQQPLIKKLDAQLVEGSSYDQSILLLKITEAQPWRANLTVNNHNSANSGEFQGIASIAHQNLFGFRDRLGLDYSLTAGFDALNIAYSLPLNTRGSKLSVEYRKGNNEITQGSFDDLGIRANGNTIRFQFDQSIIQELNQDLGVFMTLDRRNSNTFIEDDFPFAFSEGTDEGRSRVTALRLGGSWAKRSETLVTAFQTQLSAGVDLFNPTINENAADGIFFSWLGQFQLVKALDRKQDNLFLVRLATQLSPDSLLPLEQISIGGAETVRGYGENRGVADNGVYGTVELQFPLIRDSQVGDLKLIPFFDAGTIWNSDGEESLTLASLGLGIDWEIKEWFLIELDWGFPLIETSDFDESVQDSGVHFQLQIAPF